MRALLVAFALCTGCVSAQFHSKTGAALPQLTPRAVIVDEAEEAAVLAAGAVEIGTIDAQGMALHQTNDLTDKAAAVAAAHGGTHVVLADTGTIEYTQDNPATFTKSCSRDDDGYECERTYSPATTTTSSRPTAAYTVLRVPAERWGQLPENLRPAYGH